MKILYVTQVRLDRPQGASRHVIAVVRELARLGNEVALFAPGRLDPPIPGVEQHLPPIEKPGLRLEAVISTQLPLFVARFRPDVALIRLSPSGLFTPTLLATLGIPVVLELNGPTLDELLAAKRDRRMVAGLGLVLQQVVRSAKVVVAVSPTLASYAREVFKAKDVEVVENGADLETAVRGSKAEARAELGLPDGPIIAFAGSFVPEQRFDLLFEAHRHLPEARLVFAGDGAQAPAVRAYVEASSDRARYLGPLPHRQAITLLSAADIAVDVREGHLGMKCREYLALGRRFVIFDFDGVSRLAALASGLEIVHPVASKDPESLRRALVMALDAEARRGPVPEEALVSVRAQIGWDRTAKVLAAVLARASRSG